MFGTTLPKTVVIDQGYVWVTFRHKNALKYTELDPCRTEMANRIIEGAVVYGGPTIGRGEWKTQMVAIPEIGIGGTESQLGRAVDLAISVAYLVEDVPAWQCPTLLPFMGAICG
jgi:hypothetical protein